jgi:prepilin-type N-terminal cleavage/methylation domain-containing protein
MGIHPVRLADRRRHDRHGQGRRWPAFTLIEVLVVVAIIALLIAILLPSLKRARDNVKCTMCLTNLHDTALAMHQYTVQYNSYYPLVPYIGSGIYWDNPFADDNLFVLWWTKLCRNVSTFTCPATNHRIRPPYKVVQQMQAGGIRFNIYCDPKSSQVRNDFEFHGELITENVQDPAQGIVPVEGHGTSYEYQGWIPAPDPKLPLDPITNPDTGIAPGTTTDASKWYPYMKPSKLSSVGGAPLSLRSLKRPATTSIMNDADEGVGQGDVVGAPPGAATNNVPEPWDNHGAAFTNKLYGDGHVKTVRPPPPPKK